VHFVQSVCFIEDVFDMFSLHSCTCIHAHMHTLMYLSHCPKPHTHTLHTHTTTPGLEDEEAVVAITSGRRPKYYFTHTHTHYTYTHTHNKLHTHTYTPAHPTHVWEDRIAGPWHMKDSGQSTSPHISPPRAFFECGACLYRATCHYRPLGFMISDQINATVRASPPSTVIRHSVLAGSYINAG
jgi:hypothetical protein